MTDDDAEESQHKEWSKAAVVFRTQCSVIDSWSARSVLPCSFPSNQLSFSKNELGSKSDDNFWENPFKRLPSSFLENESWLLGNEHGSTLLADQESITEHWVLNTTAALLHSLCCDSSASSSVKQDSSQMSRTWALTYTENRIC